MTNSVCFIGHRTIIEPEKIKSLLLINLTELIELGKTNFIFGDHSAFDSLCYDTVSELKEIYPHIQRIKYRTNYPEIRESSMVYFLKGYEKGICPEGVDKAGRASYVMRNQAMIQSSEICVFYYNPEYRPARKSLSHNQSKSGTQIAFDYAKSQHKQIVNIFELAQE